VRTVFRLCTIAVISLVAIGCGNETSSSGPTAAAIETAGVAIETPSPDDLDAIRFRTSVGLRADVPYIRAVAANPAASSRDFGVPLLPAELAELNARATNTDAVLATIQAYTAMHPGEFAGLYLDQENGGAVTTLWIANLEGHASAIRSLVRPGSRIAFGTARFSLVDLRALQDQIVADWDWMRPLGIAPMGVGANEMANRVEVEVSSANPNTAAIVLEHYAAPVGMLVVESDGTGAALVPEGLVKGRVLDSLGKPPGPALASELTIAWTSDGRGDCSAGAGHGVGANGRFELPCQAGGHTIEVQILVREGPARALASGHVIAIAHGTVGLEIRLDDPWSSVTP
jgi:hypothetical protein